MQSPDPYCLINPDGKIIPTNDCFVSKDPLLSSMTSLCLSVADEISKSRVAFQAAGGESCLYGRRIVLLPTGEQTAMFKDCKCLAPPLLGTLITCTFDIRIPALFPQSGSSSSRLPSPWCQLRLLSAWCCSMFTLSPDTFTHPVIACSRYGRVWFLQRVACCIVEVLQQ